MTTDISFATRAHEENWLPILELAVEEVFEIMLGCRVKPAPSSEHMVNEEFTAMVGFGRVAVRSSDDPLRREDRPPGCQVHAGGHD